MDDLAIEPQRRSRAAKARAAAVKIEPHGQGDFDGLCGLYSPINALRLLFAASGRPLNFGQCERLFRTGV